MGASYLFPPFFIIAYIATWTLQDTVYALVTTNSVIDVVLTTLLQYHCVVQLVDIAISAVHVMLRSSLHN